MRPPSSHITLPVKPIPESYWVLPGRMLAGEYPGALYAPEVARKRLNAFLRAGFNTIIDLTCEGETEDYRPILQEQAGYLDLQVECFRFPINDYDLPTQE